MIRIVGTVKSNLRDDIKANLVPLVRLGEELATRMRDRIHTQGLAGDGAPWSSYKSKRKPPKRGDRFYWTKVGEPAPDKHRVSQATTGKYAGRSAYPSYAHWREAMGVTGDQKRFKLTAELEESLIVNATRPAVVTITYNGKMRRAKYGRAKSGKPYSNQKVAQFAFRTERMSPMVPTVDEVKFATDYLREHVPAQILKDVRAAGIEAAGRSRGNRVIGRANKLLTGAGVRVK